jgi:ribonuclease D
VELSDLPPPLLIDDAAKLERMVRHVAREEEIAVDTEADSFFSYREKVCLIQVTAGERDYLVDPLAGFDLAPIGEVLQQASITKVFHDGEYDVLLLKRSFGFRIRNLFDTRVAAATLGSQNPGLASVLRERFSIQLDKAMQRSNWGQRPLSDKQIDYARLDTHFLLPLAAEQRRELEESGRDVIVAGECARLERLEPSEPAFHPDEFVRLKGARTLSPMGRQVLRELFVLRERKADARNQPPFRVINNDVLVRIAAARPRSLRDLAHIDGFSERQVGRLGDDVLQAVRRAEELGPLKRLPTLPSRDGTSVLSDEEYELHERLKQWRKVRAQKEGIDSGYLLNRHVLLALAARRPRTLQELVAADGILPWQVERFGDEILGLVADFEEGLSAGRVELVRRRGR